jgi:hypothetical protein
VALEHDGSSGVSVEQVSTQFGTFTRRQGTKEQAPTDVTPGACHEFDRGLHAGKRLFPVSGFLMTGASLDANHGNVA